jgi:MFS family permease
MLASIHPLGERARAMSFTFTASAYVVGSVAAGVAAGVLLGLVGALAREVAAPGDGLVAALMIVVLVAAAALDLGLAGLRIPTVHRQVNEDWLHRYRGWVYGLGFGFQLGLGVVTIVTTATVYATLALALLAGSAGAGLVIGAAFGLARAVPLLTVARVREPGQLLATHRRLRYWAPMSRRVTVGVQLAGVAVAVAVRTGGGAWLT